MPRFSKGNSFGRGRAVGSRNQSTLLFDELANEATEKLIRVVREAAEKGDMRAASIVLARTWPHRRGRPVMLDLPDVATPAGLVEAQAAVVAAMANGRITAEEATSVANVLECQRRVLETLDHARRLHELEAKAEKKADGKSLVDLLDEIPTVP